MSPHDKAHPITWRGSKFYACYEEAWARQDLEIFQILEEAGENIGRDEDEEDADDETKKVLAKTCVFGRAINLGEVSVVRNITSKGVNVNARYLQGGFYARGPSLWEAGRSGQSTIVSLLLEGARILAFLTTLEKHAWKQQNKEDIMNLSSS
jgi:hypothetical protein